MSSPYESVPSDRWPDVTRSLLARHPLTLDMIRELALSAWTMLWETRVGSGAESFRMSEIQLPAAVTACFFERLFARRLALRFPTLWRGCSAGDEKDLVYLPDPNVSVELKCSGQLGTRVFGNRSYGQDLQDAGRAKKGRSGYYILANFSGSALYLLRFGWIDAGDWRPQAAPTGQMAGLGDDVYRGKFLVVHGSYRLAAPVEILPGIGRTQAAQLATLAIECIGDLLRYTGELPPRFERLRERASLEYSDDVRST